MVNIKTQEADGQIVSKECPKVHNIIHWRREQKCPTSIDTSSSVVTTPTVLCVLVKNAKGLNRHRKDFHGEGSTSALAKSRITRGTID